MILVGLLTYQEWIHIPIVGHATLVNVGGDIHTPWPTITIISLSQRGTVSKLDYFEAIRNTNTD